MKLGLQCCQFYNKGRDARLGNCEFLKISNWLPKIHFDHWPVAMGRKQSKKFVGPKRRERMPFHWSKTRNLKMLLEELPRTRLLHSGCHDVWNETNEMNKSD